MNSIELFDIRAKEHFEMFSQLMNDEEIKKTVANVSDDICKALHNGGRLLLCGNGGSASDAQHIAAELVGRFQKMREAYDAEALTVNTSTLTSVGNDYGYNSVFSRQVEAKGRPGDVLIGISTSGTSPNVVEALKLGNDNGLITVMMKGDREVAELSDYCNYVISAPSGVTARVQEGHIFIGHMIAEMVEENLSVQ